MEEEQTLLIKYQEINCSYKKIFIFNLGQSAGFYSEFNNMILAIIYCLEQKIQFKIYSKDARFCYDKGWNDFFEPFCFETRSRFHHFFNRRGFSKKRNFKNIVQKIAIDIYKLFYPNTLLTSDLWQEFHNRNMENRTYTFPEIGIYKEDLLNTTKVIISLIYRFNSGTQIEIDKLIKSVNVPSNIIGLHIRRGDKIIEHEDIQNDAYINKCIQISNIRNVFVLTDDYSVIIDLQKNYNDWIFYTLTRSDENGYKIKKLTNLSPEKRKNEMIKLFSSMEILKHSQFFIGTYSANPGMFLGMCMDRNKNFGIDLNSWQIW